MIMTTNVESYRQSASGWLHQVSKDNHKAVVFGKKSNGKIVDKPENHLFHATDPHQKKRNDQHQLKYEC